MHIYKNKYEYMPEVRMGVLRPLRGGVAEVAAVAAARGVPNDGLMSVCVMRSLKCVAVCCSALQYVALCRSELQQLLQREVYPTTDRCLCV